MRVNHAYGAETAVTAAPSAPWFDYDTAFSRNIGWFTEHEQQALRRKRVAIAGMGGVGGIHMLTFARLGVEHFHVADLDRFELANFNRQAGASVRTLGQPKAESVVVMAREINPNIDAKIFDHGVDEANLDAFLDGVDVYIDGLDFFVLDIRRKLFMRARERGIPAVTAGPLGFGTGYIVFTPQGMSFEDYFRLSSKNTTGQYINFMLGLVPTLMHRHYVADPSRVDMLGKRGPSTAIACQLCAGVAAAEAVKLMLGRGRVRAAPYFHHFDPYLGRFKIGKLRWGNDGPWQRIKYAAVSRLIGRYSASARPPEEDVEFNTPVMTRILEAARWAPSADNAQPWRFEQRGARAVRVEIDLEKGNPYQYRGAEPNLLAVGMLVEAMALAAAQYGWALTWQPAPVSTDEAPAIDVQFTPESGVRPDPLAQQLKTRSVDRGAYRRTPLRDQDKSSLAAALGPNYLVEWFETDSERSLLGRINAMATTVRMRSRACFDVHRRVIDWDARFSRTGMPAAAIGVDPLAQRIMRWGLKDWQRVVLGTRLGGHLYAAVEMDLLPARNAAAFAVIRAKMPLEGPNVRIEAGRRLMRFWLEADRLGIALQPSLAPIWLAAQLRAETASGVEPEFRTAAEAIANRYREATGYDAETVLFQARLGYSRAWPLRARSIRRPLAELMRGSMAEPMC